LKRTSHLIVLTDGNCFELFLALAIWKCCTECSCHVRIIGLSFKSGWEW